MKHDEYKRSCEVCGTRLPRAARYCSHCGQSVRELEDFETPVSQGQEVAEDGE